MVEYCEIPAPGCLRSAVECCWVASQPSVHRVLPDGCADIVFRFGKSQPELLAVGAMTRFQEVAPTTEHATVGIRFRPGVWARTLGVEAQELTDATVPLEEFWSSSARRLLDRMSSAATSEERIRFLLEAAAGRVHDRTPAQRAIGLIEARHGLVSLGCIAREAGVSTRQFRRICLRETGLSPKLLARILRFRHAASRVATESGAHAGLAAECGFSDQAHMIAEFRRFAGRTPHDAVRPGVKPAHPRTATGVS